MQMWASKQKHTIGFTIVELLVVVVVIAILAAISLVAYNGIIDRANDASAKEAASGAGKKIVVFSVENAGQYPSDASSGGVVASGGTTYQYSVDNTGSGAFCVTATVKKFSYYTSNNQLTPQSGACFLHVAYGASVVPTNTLLVSTLAGSAYGYTDATGVAAQFDYPKGIVADALGNVYVADSNNNRIRKVTPAGVVTTFAGSGSYAYADGTGTSASFAAPSGLAIDTFGTLYVADNDSHKVRKITQAGEVTSLAGSSFGYAEGQGTAAQFFGPASVAVDLVGNVYVADSYNHRIRKVTPGGLVSTFAGDGGPGSTDGAGATARFNYPFGIAADTAGNIYVADRSNNRIRKITPGAVVSTLAGSSSGYVDATGAAARFTQPHGVSVDLAGNVYVADTGNHRIRKVTPGGVVTTVAGSTVGTNNGTGTAAQFNTPRATTILPSGVIYVADHDNDRIRKIE